jgi:putative transcriptional regulator
MHVEIGYRKICHLVNCIQLVTMRLSSNLRTGLGEDNMPMTEKELRKRDAQRDLGAELLESVSQMVAGKGRVVMSPVISARKKSGLSQTEFAKLLGVSVRTLQEWEQGRRQPSGAAKTLIAIAERRPEVLREVAA